MLIWRLGTDIALSESPSYEVNKLVSLAWLLWALRNFWRFTLHYIMIELKNINVEFLQYEYISDKE